MTLANFTKTATSGAALGMVVLVGMLVSLPRGQAQSSDDTPRIQQGLAIAPVPLNLVGLDPNLVGLGSYLVNVAGNCNDCHNAGPGNNQFLPGGNPFFGQSKLINKATYLGGGRDFGPVVPGGSAHIITRNLTPDKTGLPEGGHTFAEFVQIMRTGVDLDHLHPTCSGTIDASCVPPPFNGNLLQVMPWFNFQDMSDHDLQAIYAYLSAIPCVAGPPAPDPLHNDCGTPPPPGGGNPITILVTGPGGATSASNTFATFSNQVTLNASQSTSTNAGTLTYGWTPNPGYPAAAVLNGNTATPAFELSSPGTYQFTLTVTDATGASATKTVTLQYL
jgi:hypothetical protein